MLHDYESLAFAIFFFFKVKTKLEIGPWNCYRIVNYSTLFSLVVENWSLCIRCWGSCTVDKWDFVELYVGQMYRYDFV